MKTFNNEIVIPTTTPTPITVYVEGLGGLSNDIEDIKNEQILFKNNFNEFNDSIYSHNSDVIFLLFLLVAFEIWRFIKGLFKNGEVK